MEEYLKNPLVQEALLEAFNQKYNDLPTENQLATTITFSNKYNRNKKKLLKKLATHHIEYKQKRRRHYASILVASFVLFIVCFQFNSVQSMLHNITLHIHQTYTDIFVNKANDNSNSISEHTTKPFIIPSNATMIQERYNDSTYIAKFMISESEVMYTRYDIVGHIETNSEQASYTKHMINNVEYNVYNKDSKSIVFWSDEIYVYTLTSTDFDLIKLVLSQ